MELLGDRLLDSIPGGKAVGQRIGPTPCSSQIALLDEESGKIAHSCGVSGDGGSSTPADGLVAVAVFQHRREVGHRTGVAKIGGPFIPPTRLVRILSLIHISEPTRLGMISYAVFCLKKKKNK